MSVKQPLTDLATRCSALSLLVTVKLRGWSLTAGLSESSVSSTCAEIGRREGGREGGEREGGREV